MQSAKTSVVAQAIEKRDDGLFIYDMGEPVVGVVAFDVSLPAPGALSVHYGEVLPELRSSQAPETPWFRQPRDRWKGKAGVQTLTGDGRRAFRYFSVQWPDARAGHVERVSIVSKPHFVEERGYFRCSDPLLNKIWTISSRTTRLCMRAYYEDGVKRDGLLWLGDCRVQYLCNTGVFGDTELMKTSLRMVAASQNEDGSVPACAAKGGGHRHPEAGYTAADRIDYMPTIPRFPSQWLLQNYMWDYVSSVREYVLFSGDLDTGHELCDSLCRVLRWLAKHGNPLEARPGHDYFTDNGFQEDGHIFARPRALRAQGLAACRDAEQLADWLGRPELACWAVAAKNTLRPTLPSEGKRPCWHSVFLERLAGIGSRDEWIRAIDNPNALRPRTAYMWYWAVEAMLRDRLYPRAMNTMRRIWGPLIHQGFDTCPEHLFENSDAYRQPGSALSYCHGWAAGPNALFAHHILGVHPRHPADPHWTPHPNTAGLRWIEGKVPSPKAEVSVRRRGNPEVGY